MRSTPLAATKRERSVTVLVVVVSIAIVGAGLMIRRLVPDRASANTPEKRSISKLLVSVEPVRSELNDVSIVARGFLEAFETVTVSAEVGGFVKAQRIEVGDKVTVGSLMFEIDNELRVTNLSRAMADVDRRRAELNRANENYARVERLKKTDSANPTEVTRFSTEKAVAEAVLKQASAMVDEARILLDRTTVESPRTGVVALVYIRQGEYARPGQAMVDIIVTDRLKLITQLGDREVVAFSLGDPVAMTAAALGEESFEGVIHAIHPRAMMDTRKFEVEIAIPNAEGRLRPGFYVQARLRRSASRTASEQVLTIPRPGVFERYRQTYCFVVRAGDDGEDRAYLTPIETVPLLSDPQKLQVVQGVSEGTMVVTSGMQHLSHESVVQMRRP